MTYIDYVETDTYISSADPANHSELPYLNLSKSGSAEERALLKLPTGNQDPSLNLEEIFKDPLSIPLMPFVIITEIFAEMFNCRDGAFAAERLEWSKLYLDVMENPTGASLAGQVSLQLVSKPWWHNANWSQAHSFSKNGRWNQAGGDLDTSVTFGPILHNGPVTNGTLEFDVTDYVKGLLRAQTPHYGLEVRATGALPKVVFASTQVSNLSQHPRLQSKYGCLNPFGLALQERQEPQPYTYILGTRR